MTDRPSKPLPKLPSDEAKPVAATYFPTLREQAVLDKQEKRKAERNPLPHFKLIDQEGMVVQTTIDHEDAGVGSRLLMESFGTDDPRIAEILTGQLAQLATNAGVFNIDAYNRSVALVQNMQPRDVFEAMLTTQMAAIHNTTMEHARRLHRAATGEAVERYERTLNRLARTFTTQIEALKKYRSKGEQKVIVEHQHVHVHPGGQAVVGNVTHGMGGEGAIQNEGQPHERSGPVRIPERSAVPCDLQADPMQMPGTSGIGVEGMPVSRRPRRTTLRAVE